LGKKWTWNVLCLFIFLNLFNLKDFKLPELDQKVKNISSVLSTTPDIVSSIIHNDNDIPKILTNNVANNNDYLNEMQNSNNVFTGIIF
jgi:hypothetical protein